MAYEFNPFTGNFDKKVSTSSDIDNLFKTKQYAPFFDASGAYIKVGVAAHGSNTEIGDTETTSYDATYSIKNANKDFAIQIWFKLKDSSGTPASPNCHMLSKIKPSTTWGFAVGIHNRKLWAHIGDENDYSAGIVNNTTLNSDTWYHAFVYFNRSTDAGVSASDRKCYGYINGVYTAPSPELAISGQAGTLRQTGSGTTAGDAMMYFGRSENDYSADGQIHDGSSVTNDTGIDWTSGKQNFKGYLAEIGIWREPYGDIDFVPAGDGTNASVTALYNSGNPVPLNIPSSYSGATQSEINGILKGWWQLNELNADQEIIDASTSVHFGDPGGSVWSTPNGLSYGQNGPETYKASIASNGIKLSQPLVLNGQHISNDGSGEGLQISDGGDVRVPGELVLGGNPAQKLLSNKLSANTYLQSQSDGGISFVGDWGFESTVKLSLNDNHAVDLVISRAGTDRAGGRLRLAGSPTEAQMMLGTIEFAKEEQADVAENAKLGALITSTSYGATGDSSMPANLTFSTTRTSSITPTPVMTITHEGKVGINLPSIAFGVSSSDATSGNTNYLKNMIQPAETFEIFGDAIYSTGWMNVTATAGSDSGTGNQMWGESDGSSAPTLTADHIGCRVIFEDHTDAGTIATYESGPPAYYTLVDSSGSALNINHVASSNETGRYKIFAPTFKVNTATGKVTCGTIEALAIGDSKNKASYDGTDFKIENTGKFAVGDTGTYINQPADGRLAVVSDGDVELTPSAISGKMAKVIKTITSTDAGDDYTALSIDLDKSGSSTSNNTMYALKIDADNITATNGVNILYGISNTPTLTHAADAGTIQVTGLVQTVTSSSNGNAKAFGIQNTVTGAGNNTGIWQQVDNGGTDLKFVSSADTGDYFSIATAAAGATTISTVDDSNGETAHLTFDIQGDTILKGDIADGTSTEVCRIDASAASLLMASSKKIELGAPEEFIYGDGTDIHIGVGSNGDINIPANIGLTFGDDGEKIEGTGTDLTISSSRYITIDTVNAQYFDSGTGLFHFLDDGDADDAFKVTVTGGTGATKLETVSDAADGHLSIVADGNIDLDSATGVFIAKKGGTEFSAANSAYAGMILGYTVIGDNATPATYDVLASMNPVHDDLKVSFVFPPSGKVEIMASIYIQTDAARPVTFGLSTTDASTGFTSLGSQYENHTFIADETDGYQHTHRWYITGTAGDSEELWFSAGATQVGRIDLFWGGNSSSVSDSFHPMEYQPFIMKATALPTGVYEG